MFNYNYLVSDTKNNKVALDSLEKEIRESNIIIALDHIINMSTNINIYFKDEISDDEENILTSIINNHEGEPIKDILIQDVNIITENKKTIENGLELPNKFYMSESWVLNIDASEGLQEFYLSKPFPIALLNAKMEITSEMVGDEMEAYVGNPITVGAVTIDASEGDTEIYVNPDSLSYLKIGRFIGVNNELINRIIDVDEINSKLTLEFPLETNLTAGTYLQLIIKIADSLFFNTTQTLDIGSAVPTGQRIPANLPIKIEYYNHSNISKIVMLFVEYLY